MLNTKTTIAAVILIAGLTVATAASARPFYLPSVPGAASWIDQQLAVRLGVVPPPSPNPTYPSFIDHVPFGWAFRPWPTY